MCGCAGDVGDDIMTSDIFMEIIRFILMSSIMVLVK